jgi:short-subunit dehydrogenase
MLAGSPTHGAKLFPPTRFPPGPIIEPSPQPVGGSALRVSGEVAVVTGASSGIGAATARELAAKGAHAVLLARNKARLDDVAAQIRASGGKASVYVVDLADPGATAAACQRIVADLGVPGIIVNNAGAGVWKFIEETTPEEARAMMALPYFAAFNVTRAFIPGMLKANRGHIVIVNSPASRFTWPGACGYTAARWAMRGFAEALRSDLFGTKLRVTHFVAGKTESDYWKNNPGSRERTPKIAIIIPVLSPEKVARALVAGIEGNKREVVVPFMMRLTYWQHALAPWAVNWMMRATGYRRR